MKTTPRSMPGGFLCLGIKRIIAGFVEWRH